MEALQEAIGWILLSPSLHRKLDNPGALISRLNKEQRAALQQLTSDDVEEIPYRDWVLGWIEDENSHTRKMKEEFDLEIMKHRKTHNPYASNVIFIRP
jgi:hypothetical protein